MSLDGKAYWFLLDTGASTTIVDPELARVHGFPLRQRARVEGIGSAPPGGWVSSAPEMVVGSLRLKDVAVGVTDISGLVKGVRVRPNGAAVRGILGADLLERFSATISYQHQTLHIVDFSAQCRVLSEGVWKVSAVERSGRQSQADGKEPFILKVTGRDGRIGRQPHGQQIQLSVPLVVSTNPPAGLGVFTARTTSGEVAGMYQIGPHQLTIQATAQTAEALALPVAGDGKKTSDDPVTIRFVRSH